MSLTHSLVSTLSLNTNGVSNSSQPVDYFNASGTFGTVVMTPCTSVMGVASVLYPATVLEATGLVATSFTGFMIRNIGSNPCTLDLQNVGAQSSKVDIQAGGCVYMFNTSMAGTTGYSDPENWVVTSTLGTTVVWAVIV